MRRNELPPRISPDELKSIQCLCHQLHQERERFQQFAQQALDEISQLRSELAACERQIADRALEADEQAQQLQRERAEWSRRQEDQQCELSAGAAELEAVKSQAASLLHERDETRRQLEKTSAELEQVAPVVQTLHATEEQLAAAQAALAEARDELAARAASQPDTTSTSEILQQLRDRNEELESQLNARDDRAEELRTKVNQQKRQLLRLKQHLSKNLQILRESMRMGTAAAVQDGAASGHDAQRAAEREHQPAGEDDGEWSQTHGSQPESATGDDGSPAAQRRADPVVDSVLARFAEMEEELGKAST